MAINCCPTTVTGFCLTDGSPIAIVFNNGAQIGWILISTSVFTAGPPPAGTIACIPEVSVGVNVEFNPLTCETDSITVCPPVSGIFDVNVIDAPVSRFLECETDSITICPPVTGIFGVEALSDYPEDSPHISGDVGSFSLAVRNDVVGSLVDANGDYAPLQVDSTGALRTSTAPIVIAQSVVSAPNSTTIPLAGGATFTGAFVDCLEFADVTITLATSDNSATDGLKVEWSTDGINVDADDVFTVVGSAGPGKQYTFGVSTKYMRVRYVNGGAPQTFFRLQTILKRVRGKPSSHRIAETITLQDDAELVKAVIAGQTTAGGGGTVNVKVNPSGTLEVNASQATSPWVVSGVDLDIRNLDCATDSVTVCQLDPFDVAITGVINTRELDCTTDSVTICPPVTGIFEVSDANTPDLTGTWAYVAGASGTEVIGAGQRVIGIAAHAGLVAGSMTINGGASIPIPANSGITINPYGQLVAPTIVFTSTDSYFVETLV